LADKNNWLLQRFVTIGYYALVDFSLVLPVADVISITCSWHSLNPAPNLMMNHNNILNKALQTLRLQINNHPIGYNLLPLKFTMPELQKLYETILGNQLDRRNFKCKITNYGILKKPTQVKDGVAYKVLFLYSFILKKYNDTSNNGLGGGW